MVTKTKNTEKTIIDSAATKAIEIASKANDIALSTVEKIGLKSISLTEKGFGLSSKIVKKGLKASAKNQEFVFDRLENVKGKAKKFFPKFK